MSIKQCCLVELSTVPNKFWYWAFKTHGFSVWFSYSYHINFCEGIRTIFTQFCHWVNLSLNIIFIPYTYLYAIFSKFSFDNFLNLNCLILLYFTKFIRIYCIDSDFLNLWILLVQRSCRKSSIFAVSSIHG